MSAVLERIRARLQRASTVKPAHTPPDAHTPRHAPGLTDAAVPAIPLVDQFSSAWRALAGHVHTASPDDVAAILIEICRAHDASRVLGWEAVAFPVRDVPSRLEAAGIEWETGFLPDDAAARRGKLAVLDGVRVGITGASGAIAASGTVAVVSGPGRSRLASLLPPVHVTVLDASRVYTALPAFLAANPGIAAEGSNLVLISGPSRTADIEMTLTRGVHGPGEVHVVLVTAV